jgi:cysteinyl-tRNA synthetase
MDGLSWNTPIGRGRPAWNVQDAAMIAWHLGYQIDISCGGVDNLYRHHDYTIAIMEGISGKRFARCWLHGEHVLVDGSKMSKSKGNTIYPHMLIKDGYHARHIRFFLLSKHYRKQLNLTKAQMQETSARLDAFRQMTRGLIDIESTVRKSEESVGKTARNLEKDFLYCMNDDLDVPRAFDGLYKNVSTLHTMNNRGKLSTEDCHIIRRAMERIDSVLQIVF